ncbi:MAG: AAA family ATPase [Fibrobacteraceae bacterium]|nr:AAA family ATPase [Fibrobacteraceae bacterium]
MNFFHIQLHPGTSLSIEQIEKILSRKIIGLGSDNEASDRFKTQIKIGDIVAIHEGEMPIALARITSDARQEAPDDILWFDLRRDIELLDKYNGTKVMPSTRKAFSICKNLNNDTSQFIINWYKKYFMEHIKESCILSDRQKQTLQALYGPSFKPSWVYREDDADKILKEWNFYKEKIVHGTLSLGDYTNILSNDDKTKTESSDRISKYLCDFLERRTKLYGSSRPGSAMQFMVKRNDEKNKKNSGNNDYYVKNGSINKNAPRTDAEKTFNDRILPLLKKIITAKDINSIKAVESDNDYNKWFEAKQILEKMIVLNNAYNPKVLLGFFYVKDAVDNLFKYFFGSELGDNMTFFEKNNAIMIVACDILSIQLTNNNREEWHRISAFLWTFERAKEMATDEAPNMIIYGPPGTGKTYSVKHNLEFLLHDQPERECFLQFHPSYSYEDFIDGLKPAGLTPQGGMKFEFVNGHFKDFCIKAKKALEEAISKNESVPNYYFVVDEINRANLSAVFGETLSLLESDYRDYKEGKKEKRYLIETQNCKILEELIKGATDNPQKKVLIDRAYEYNTSTGKVTFGIPSNIRFIGMMNDVDKSIDTFDLALRRRFTWIKKDCDYNVIEDELDNRDIDNVDEYIESCKALNNYIVKLGLGSSYEFGHSFFMKISCKNRKITKTAKIKLFDNYLSPTLREYLRGFFEESEIDSKLKETAIKFGIKDKDEDEDNDSDQP